ncbi:MAG: hypothetical protein NVSMB64_32290 [Candidatus Velthaea sp.]
MPHLALALVLVMLGTARAQTAPATAQPSPSATPGAISDPCNALLSLVNRPTVTTGSCVVKSNQVMVENGYTNTATTGTGAGNTVSYPQSFIRVGTKAQNVEVELTPPSYNRSSTGIGNGGSDLGFGVKWEIGYTAKTVYSVNVAATVPTGAANYTAGDNQYMFSANAGYALTSVFGIAASLASNNLVGTDSAGNLQRYNVFVPSVVLTAGLPNNQQLFAEYAYFSKSSPTLGSRSLIDFGYQRSFGSRTIADVEAGYQLGSLAGSTSKYLGAGISFLLF